MEKYIQQNNKIIKSLADSIDRLSMETINYFSNLDIAEKTLWDSEFDEITELDNSQYQVFKINRSVLKDEVKIIVVFQSKKYNAENLPYYLKGFVARLLIEKYSK